MNTCILIAYVQQYFRSHPTNYSAYHINRLENYKTSYYKRNYSILLRLSEHIDPYTRRYDYEKYVNMSEVLSRLNKELTRGVTREEISDLLDEFSPGKNHIKPSIDAKHEAKMYDLLLMTEFQPRFFDDLFEKGTCVMR